MQFPQALVHSMDHGIVLRNYTSSHQLKWRQRKLGFLFFLLQSFSHILASILVPFPQLRAVSVARIINIVFNITTVSNCRHSSVTL